MAQGTTMNIQIYSPHPYHPDMKEDTGSLATSDRRINSGNG